jgi:energy-coupling factor transporter ATP-binding protein EcfA2
MLRLTRLRIDRFRNVRPGTELAFGPTFNVLLGKNATGKSTLLDLIAAITDSDFSAYAAEPNGFDLSWTIEGELSGDPERRIALEVTVRRVAVEVRAREGGPVLEPQFDDHFELRVRGAYGEGCMALRGSVATWTGIDGLERTFQTKAGFMDVSGLPAALFQAANQLDPPRTGAKESLSVLEAALFLLSGRSPLGRFDEARAAFDSLTTASFRESVRADGRGSTLRPGPWLSMMFFHGPKDDFRPLSSLDEPISGIPGILGFASARVRLRVLQSSRDEEQTTTLYRGLDFLFAHRDGTEISNELLSFGQKRMFAFLWYLAVRDDHPVIADELMNGLHHEWIETAMDRIRDRQSFLATQHPLLLDHVPIASANDVRRMFVRCTSEERPNGGVELVWRNLDEEEADRLFTAYQTGIQHVSEILRSEGLW